MPKFFLSVGASPLIHVGRIDDAGHKAFLVHDTWASVTDADWFATMLRESDIQKDLDSSEGVWIRATRDNGGKQLVIISVIHIAGKWRAHLEPVANSTEVAERMVFDTSEGGAKWLAEHMKKFSRDGWTVQCFEAHTANLATRREGAIAEASRKAIDLASIPAQALADTVSSKAPAKELRDDDLASRIRAKTAKASLKEGKDAR